MADKTTTLKTKTNDNVYPNVIGDNRKNAFVDSSTITHHFYDKTHKVGFQIANETNIKIQNSLQKPAGLTKTKLVGVGTNGQENIEIGDNLTLANGKLSATGGSGGDAFDIITDNGDETYTGTITGNKPVIMYTEEGQLVSNIFVNYEGEKRALFTQVSILDKDSTAIVTLSASNGKIIYDSFNISNYYYHYITLTKDNDKIYLQYQCKGDVEFDIGDLAATLLDKKVICTGVLGNSDETIATPLYVSGETGVKLKVYYTLKNDTSGTITSKYITDFTITDLVKPV